MRVERLTTAAGAELEGPLLITPKVLGDARGFFFESWNQRAFDAAAGHACFVQDNHSGSAAGVLRGLHYQLPPHAQGKLVRCVIGSIFDVAVDIRRGSPTFGEWAGVELSAENKLQLWVPPGYAHGFLILSEHAEVLYKTTAFWCRDSEHAICWDDPQLAIAWPLERLGSTASGPGLPQLSPRDAAAPSFAQAVAAGDVFR